MGPFSKSTRQRSNFAERKSEARWQGAFDEIYSISKATDDPARLAVPPDCKKRGNHKVAALKVSSNDANQDALAEICSELRLYCEYNLANDDAS